MVHSKSFVNMYCCWSVLCRVPTFWVPRNWWLFQWHTVTGKQGETDSSRWAHHDAFPHKLSCISACHTSEKSIAGCLKLIAVKSSRFHRCAAVGMGFSRNFSDFCSPCYKYCWKIVVTWPRIRSPGGVTDRPILGGARDPGPGKVSLLCRTGNS